MKKRTISKVIFIFIILAIFSIFLTVPITSTEPSIKLIKQSNEIENLQQSIYDQGYNYTVSENHITRLSTKEQEVLYGYIPEEILKEPPSGNIKFFSNEPMLATKNSVGSTPSSYDAMALGHVTPIKNQGACGSCWIFGVIADFESDVAISESDLLDFSEQEVGDCNIWSSEGGYNFCDGGNALMAINYLTKYGSSDESCRPYQASSQSCQNCPKIKNVDNWRMITGSSGQDQIETIKNAIINYGPVYSTIYAGNSGFHAYNGGVYEFGGTNPVNHAIQIIGWNDTLGAWMIKNSWGTGWGASGPYPGCAWVAYGSANLGDYTSAIVSYKNPVDQIFYHDECGWRGASMGENNPTAYGAVRFTPEESSTLTAVDFWAVDDDMGYEIKIFDTLNYLGGGRYSFSDQIGSTQTGTTNGGEPGYYSIPLDTSVPLANDDDFIIQIKLTTTGWGYPIPIDYTSASWLNWGEIATFSDESYYSDDGMQFEKPSPYDIGIRARAQSSLVSNLEISLNPDGTTTLSWDGNPSDSYDIYITEDYQKEFPSTPNYTLSGLSWTDTNAAKYPKRYYDIGVNGFSRIEDPVGKLDYSLHIKPGGTGKNLISIPFGTEINTASELMDDIGRFPLGNCTVVNRWNPITQKSEGLVNLGTGKDFDLVPGEGYEVWVNKNTSWTAVGKVLEPKTIELHKKADETGKNWISLPICSPLSDASELIDDIGRDPLGNCTVVNRWDPKTQKSEGLLNIGMGNNFDLVPGMGYEVWVKENTSWTPLS